MADKQQRPGFLRRLFGAKSSTVDGMTITELPEAMQIMKLYGSWSTLGGMYERQPAVRIVVDFLARNLAGISVKVYERVSRTDRVELDEHPLAVILRNPNPRTTAYDHMFATVADIAVYDVAYWYKLRVGRRVTGVRRVPPSFVVVDTRTMGTDESSAYRWADGRPINRDDLVIFGGYSPSSNITGTPPLETLRRTLAEDWAASQNREGYWYNAARILGVIERPLDAPVWSDEEFKRFRTDWQNAMSGAVNSGKTGILEDGMTYRPAMFSPKDSQFLEGKYATKEEAAQVLGIQPTMVGLLEHATFSNITEQHKQVYQDTLGPWTRRIEDPIELQLLPELEPLDAKSRVYAEFNIEEKLRGSFAEAAAALASSIGVPIMAVNEGRAKLNLPKVPNDLFDVPVMPANVVYGGQPAVNVPLADPGTPPGLMSQEPDFTDQLRQVLVRYFERQRRSLASADAKFDARRWTRELTDDLHEPALALVSYAAKDTDPESLASYAAEWSGRVSEGVNTRTRLALVEHKASDVFDTLAGGIGVLAQDMATDLQQWAVTRPPQALAGG